MPNIKASNIIELLMKEFPGTKRRPLIKDYEENKRANRPYINKQLLLEVIINNSISIILKQILLLEK